VPSKREGLAPCVVGRLPGLGERSPAKLLPAGA